jgi:hypothetical protein
MIWGTTCQKKLHDDTYPPTECADVDSFSCLIVSNLASQRSVSHGGCLLGIGFYEWRGMCAVTLLAGCRDFPFLVGSLPGLYACISSISIKIGTVNVGLFKKENL